MSRTIIALTGRARAGKDTVAAHLAKAHGFQTIALADEVRRAALAINPWVCVEDTHDVLPSLAPVRLAHLVNTMGWDRAKQIPEVRRLLQTIGTEAGWQIHGVDLWTSRADTKIAELAPDTPVVITDARMPHEQLWIDRIGATVIEIQRPDNPHELSGTTATHLSEQGGIRAEHVLLNDSTKEALYHRIDALLAQITDHDEENH